MFSIWEIDEEIARFAPENLFACYSDVLLQIARDDNAYSDEIRTPCIAELFVRRTVFQSKSVKDADIDEVLTNGERVEFLNRMSPLRIHASDEANRVGWTPVSEFSKRCLCAVKAKCRLVYGADGFIPVYETETREAMFIPFRFDAPSCGEVVVRDTAKMEIAEWTAHWRELTAGSPLDKRFDVVLLCSVEHFGRKMTGRSLMLPLLLAWKRKCGVLPQYDTLGLFSTGAIIDGALAAVDVEEKLGFARGEMPGAYFIYPSRPLENALPGEIRLSPGTGVDAVVSAVDKLVVGKGLARLDYKSAYCRLVAMEAEVRGTAFGGWKAIIDRLSNLSDSIPGYRDGENHLLALMLVSAAYCHAGNTNAALQVNRDAREYARTNGFDEQVLRLEVEELVCLQDVESFAEVLTLAVDLGGRIEKSGSSDLLMRYYGTRGQAHAYSALAGFEGEAGRGKSLDCFHQAVKYACGLLAAAQSAGDDAEVLARAGDVAQDLNYICLWHALFGEVDLVSFDQARTDAINHLDGECAHLPDAKDMIAKNDVFLRRITALASYRALLHGADAKDLLSNPRLRQQPDDAKPSWITATTDKYIAAINAAAGNVAEADKLFCRAWKATDGNPNQIIGFIRFTIACEAVRSFRMARRDDLVRQWLVRANGQWGTGAFSAFASAKMFRDFLDGNGDFPGIRYWY